MKAAPAVTPESRSSKSRLSVLMCVMTAAMTACASHTPTGLASASMDKGPLTQLVLSGQVEPNAYMPVGYADYGYTPLCALLGGAKIETIRAIDLLLERGADVNRPCTNEKGGYPSGPLDVATGVLITATAEQSPYRKGDRSVYDPHIPAYLAQAEKLLARGAISRRSGATTMAELIDYVGRVNGIWATTLKERRERLAAEEKDSLFTAENLTAALTVAGTAAQNYNAARASAQIAAAAPLLAIASPSPPAKPVAAAQKPATAGIQQDNARRAQQEADERRRVDTARASTQQAASSTASVSTQPRTAPKIEWGPRQLEAIALCRQGAKSGKWACDGALDNQSIVDEPTLASALSRQHCPGGTLASGGPVIGGVKWEAYRCGHGLGAGDYDVAQRRGLNVERDVYICPRGQSGDGRCATPYEGQDRR